MNGAPNYKVPGGAMPQPGQQKHDPKVQQRSPFTAPVSSERNVDVVAKPSRERDMPTSPKILNRRCSVCVDYRMPSDDTRLNEAAANLATANHAHQKLVDDHALARDHLATLEAIVAQRGDLDPKDRRKWIAIAYERNAIRQVMDHARTAMEQLNTNAAILPGSACFGAQLKNEQRVRCSLVTVRNICQDPLAGARKQPVLPFGINYLRKLVNTLLSV